VRVFYFRAAPSSWTPEVRKYSSF